MNKTYYLVYLKEDNRNLYLPIICECIAKTNTKKYGFAYIFKDIITNKIVRPYYDTLINKIYNQSFGTLTYDNVNKEYRKISTKKVLQYLKNINIEDIEEQIVILNSIEERHIPKIRIL